MTMCRITNIDNSIMDVEILIGFKYLHNDYLVYTLYETDENNLEVIYVVKLKKDGYDWYIYDVDDNKWNIVKDMLENMAYKNANKEVLVLDKLPDMVHNSLIVPKALKVTAIFIESLKNYNLDTEEEEDTDILTKIQRENNKLKQQQQQLFFHIEELSNEIKEANKKYQTILDKMLKEKPGLNAKMVKDEENV